MDIKKIVTIVGARPQFIKAAPLSKYIAELEEIEEVIVHTGQHYDAEMSDVFFREMKIPAPKYNLAIGGGGHGEMTGRMLEGLERILIKEKPDCVLVYGDTNSTLAGALAAKKMNIKVAHVEAGLRSHNMKMPEEINRILTDRISDFLFCTSAKPVANLEREGVQYWKAKVVVSGDIMKDAVMLYEQHAVAPQQVLLAGERYCLVTVHRAENTDDPVRLKAIFGALKNMAGKEKIVLPVHPRTRDKIREYNIDTGEILLIDPVGYFNMVWLLKNCQVVITDSGGLQKEAYYFGRPCIILRDETEWKELVDNDFSALVGANSDAILDARYNFRFNTDYSSNFYGDGNACSIIVRELTGVKK